MLVRLIDLSILVYSIFYLSLFVTDYSFMPALGRAGINNIAGPTGGLAVLLAARFLIDRDSFAKNPVVAAARRISGSSGFKICLAASGILFIVLSAVSIARHYALSSGASDLGIFDQAVWNTARGDVLFSSLKGNYNLLGDHFEPVLVLLAPLYFIWSDAAMILIAQALLLSLAVFPLYLIAREKLSGRALVLAFVVSYVVSKPLRGAAFSDFHPECFLLLFSFWAYYFLIKKKNAALFVSVLFMLASKEDAAFLVSALGIYAGIFEKRRALGLGLFILGIAAWIIETKFIIAAFHPSGAYPYMSRLPFGTTYAGNIQAVAEDPSLLAKIFLEKGKIAYIIKLMGPLAFLPLLSPGHYILIAIPLLRNILPVDPSFSGHYNITSHYTASVIPFMYIAAIYGAAGLCRKAGSAKAPLWVAILVLLTSLFYYGKTDAHKFWRFVRTIKEERTLEKLSYLKQVPDGVSVAANFNLVPHLSHRKYVFEWNPLVEPAFVSQYLVIDMTLLEYLGKQDRSEIGVYFEKIGRLGYRKVFEARDGTFFIYHNPALDPGSAENLFKSNR